MTNSKVCELINENNFKTMLTNELYALIDEELAKGDEMDCELIDELVLAIESLEQNEYEKSGIMFPVIFGDASGFSKRVINKVNNRNRLMQLTAWAAVIAILCSGTNELLLRSENTTLVNELSKMVQKVSQFLTSTFNNDAEEETTTSPAIDDETTTLPADDEIEQPEEVTLMSIELVVGDNFKRSYLWQEKLDLNGLHIVAVYSNAARTSVDVNKCRITGFDSLKIGEQTVTVEYKGHQASFKVTISRTQQNDEATRTITNIECNSTGKDIVVPKGTENPAVTKNVKYRYVYSDGTFSPWTSCKDATLITEYNSELLDEIQTLTYRAPNGMEFTINVIVYDNTVQWAKTVKKLEVTKMPKSMKYYASNHNQYYMYVGEECDFSEFEIKAYYSDNTVENLQIGDNSHNVKAFGTMSTERPSSYSGYTITFAYGDVTTTFKYDVIIKSEIHSYSINERIWQTYYVNDAPEEFPINNVVIARMNDSNDDVYLDVEVKGYDPNKIGFVELELYYEGEKLCDYVGGYIYGDTGYAVIDRPITDGVANAPLKFRPYVTVAKCVGNGKFETYADIKYEIDDNPINDPSVNLSSGVGEEERAMGITGFRCVCIDSSIVEYTISADEYITEFGTHEAKVYLYNVEPVYGKYNYVERWERTDIAEDLSYTITIKEKPSYYQLEAPKNLKINIQDIYTEFYDKVKVYAVYKDGRKEETNDYSVTRYLPSRPTTSACLLVYFQFPDGNANRRNIYVYNEGYEDSFFITLNEYDKEHENYYLVGASRPNIRIDFSSAGGLIDYLYTRYDDDDDIWDVEGWDTSTPGEKEAIITYHSPIGDMKATYKYVVVEKYEKCDINISFNKPFEIYDITTGFEDCSYSVIYKDSIGKEHIITEYDIAYELDYVICTFKNPKDPNATEPLKYKWEIPENVKVAGAVENLDIEWLDDGRVKATINCPIQPKNGYIQYKVYIRIKYGNWSNVISCDIATTDNVIIFDPEKNLPAQSGKVAFNIRTNIVFNDSERTVETFDYTEYWK